MLKNYDQHLSFDLPYGYEAVTGTNDDGTRSFSINCGTERNSDGESTAEVKILLRHLDGALAPDNSNFKGDFPARMGGSISEMGLGIQLRSSYSSSPGRTLKIQLLFFLVGMSCERDSYAFIAVKTGKEESFSDNTELIAKHMNRVLSCIELDGKPGNFQKLSGRDVQRVLKEGKASSEGSVNQFLGATTAPKKEKIQNPGSIKLQEKTLSPEEEARRQEEKVRKAEEARKNAAKEAERKRKAEEAEAKYSAWEKERKQILSRRESLAQQQIDSRNAKLKAEATQIRQEYDEKYGAIVSKKAEAEKDLAEAKKKRAEVEARPTKGSTIMFAWGIGQALLGMLCIGMESPGIGLVNLIFGVAILGFGVYLKSLSRTSLSKAARAEQAASEALANIPPFPTVEQYAEENKERLNPASLKNGSQITDAQKRDIRSQIDRENPLPIEPPKPASRQRTSYSASVSSSYSASASSSSRALTGQQSKNEIIKKAIELTLESDGPMTVAELLEAVPELDGESAQHASALCRSLRLEGRIESFTDKRKTYFRISE